MEARELVAEIGIRLALATTLRRSCNLNFWTAQEVSSIFVGEKSATGHSINKFRDEFFVKINLGTNYSLVHLQI